MCAVVPLTAPEQLPTLDSANRRHPPVGPCLYPCNNWAPTNRPTDQPTDQPQATEIPALDLKRSLQSLACVKGKNVLRKVRGF